MRILLNQESVGNTVLLPGHVPGSAFECKVKEFRAVSRNEKVLLIGDLNFLQLIFLNEAESETGERLALVREDLP